MLCFKIFLALLKSELFYLQEFEPRKYFKAEWVEFQDCNNKRIKAKRKGLASALHSQQALSAASTALLELLSNFLDLLHYLRWAFCL